MPLEESGTPETKYVPSEADATRVENGLSYHPMTDAEQGARYESNRLAAKKFAKTIMGNCPPSRELSLAITNLQQALMWANAAIAVNE
jgi:hypothetical protein